MLSIAHLIDDPTPDPAPARPLPSARVFRKWLVERLPADAAPYLYVCQTSSGDLAVGEVAPPATPSQRRRMAGYKFNPRRRHEYLALLQREIRALGFGFYMGAPGTAGEDVIHVVERETLGRAPNALDK